MLTTLGVVGVRLRSFDPGVLDCVALAWSDAWRLSKAGCHRPIPALVGVMYRGERQQETIEFNLFPRVPPWVSLPCFNCSACAQGMATGACTMGDLL